MKTTLLTATALLGIVVSSSRIHTMLIEGSSISKIEFLIILCLIIADALILELMFYYYNKLKKICSDVERYVSEQAPNAELIDVYLENMQRQIQDNKTSISDNRLRNTDVSNRVDELFSRLS